MKDSISKSLNENCTPYLAKQMLRQISFLERSCAIFDEGDRDEAIRIGGVLRTLIHDTGSSTSLLQQMGIKDEIHLASSCALIPIKVQTLSFDEDPEGYVEGVRNGNIVFAADPLTTIDDNNVIQPILGRSGEYYPLSVIEWWEKFSPVVMPVDKCFTRKQIIVWAANKDGASHVDKYPGKYKELDEGFWMQNGEKTPEHQFVLLRQFAFEFLKGNDIIEVIKYCEQKCNR